MSRVPAHAELPDGVLVACRSGPRICRTVFRPNRSGSEHHPNYTWVLLFSLVEANRRPASAVSNQHHLPESSIRGEVNPGSEVSRFLTGHTSITAAADPFIPSPPGDVSKVMHARVGSDACIAALREGSANHHVCRIVKVHPPSMDPDDGDGLG